MYDRATLAAIAAGGVLGASLRWAATRTYGSGQFDDSWFVYAPNTSVTPSTDVSGLAQGGQTVTVTFETATGVRLDSLAVNALGCLLLGIFTVLLVKSTGSTRRLLIGAATGLCGSLTTFSTFAVEVAVRLRGRPVLGSSAEGVNFSADPSVSAALVYLVGSVVGAAIAFWLGRTITKRIVDTPGVSTIGEAT